MEGSHVIECRGAEVIKDLALAGADVEAVDIVGESCVVKAITSGCDKCLHALLKTPSPLKKKERERAVQVISDTVPRVPLQVVKLLVEFFIPMGASPFAGEC